MAQTNVAVREQVWVGEELGWRLALQWCRYIYPDGETQEGYRFIWRRPAEEGGGLQAARGQARLPSLRVARRLMELAEAAGWADLAADDADAFI